MLRRYRLLRTFVADILRFCREEYNELYGNRKEGKGMGSDQIRLGLEAVMDFEGGTWLGTFAAVRNQISRISCTNHIIR